MTIILAPENESRKTKNQPLTNSAAATQISTMRYSLSFKTIFTVVGTTMTQAINAVSHSKQQKSIPSTNYV